MILGIDEVGRGAWAGPLVVGACVWPDNVKLDKLTDSKKLTKKQREQLGPDLQKLALAFGLGWVSAGELDQIGLAAALRLATARAVEQIDPKLYDRIIIDGTVDFLDSPLVTVMKQADLLVPSVSAAANLAKVARDRMIAELDNQATYANYQFAKHVGYGTKLHQEMLAKYGPSDQHRLSFRPVAQVAQQYHLPNANLAGKIGEDLAAAWLENNGFEILARNWRTKLFEIDIVVCKADVLGLIEVKTRQNDYFGGGLAAIDAHKIAKLRQAGELILQKPEFADRAVRIGVVTVEAQGDKYVVDDLLWLE